MKGRKKWGISILNYKNSNDFFYKEHYKSLETSTLEF